MIQCKLDDLIAWRRKHEHCDPVYDCSGGHGAGVKQLMEQPVQGFAFGRPIELGGFVYVAINVGAGKAAFYQLVARPLKFVFGFFKVHGGTK
jgi:hypothetical protein